MNPRTAKTFVIVGALGAAAVFAVWLGVRSFVGDAGEYTDGENVYFDVEGETVRHAVWGPAQSLGPGVNTNGVESRAAISPDGRWLVFAVGERGLGCDLFASALVAGEARDPEPIATLNTSADELAPAFSATHIYFASDREGGAGGLDLWRASYAEGEFGAAERVAPELQSKADDCDPAPVPASTDLVFASNREGSFDLYRARSTVEGDVTTWSVEALAELNGTRDEREPAFVADGRALFFASDRRESLGSFDLFRCALAADGWLAPIPVAGVNTKECERAPLPSPEGFGLYFARGADERSLDLYRARSIELFELPLLAVSWVELAILASLVCLALAAAIARRFPSLDFIYKCFLVSILVHIVLLVWFQYVYMEGGRYRDRAGARHRVRVVAPESVPLARQTERAGEVEFQRSAASDRDAPIEIARESFSAASPEPERAPEDLGLARAPQARDLGVDPSARERTAALEPAARASDVRLEDAAEVPERRSASAPELGIASVPIEHRPTREPTAEPQRFAAGGAGGDSSAPSAWTPSAPEPNVDRSLARDRARGDLSPAARTSGSNVSVAAPAERAERRESSPAPSIALQPSEGGGAARARATPSVEPQRCASSATAVSPTAPRAWAPSAPAADQSIAAALPSRALTSGDVGPVSRAHSADVDVAAPAERAAGSVASSPAPSMVLEPSALAPGGAGSGAGRARSHPDAPDRFESSLPAFGAPGGTSLDRPSAPELGLLQAPGAPAPAPSRGGANSAEPARPRSPSVALADRETIERRGANGPSGVRGSSGSGGPSGARSAESARGSTSRDGTNRSGPATSSGDDDFLAALLPSGPATSVAPGGGAPEITRWTAPTPESDARSDSPASSLTPLIAAPERAEREAPSEERPRWENTPYQNRAGEEKARALELHGGTKETEEAVARGLRYLASIQQEEGNWGDYGYVDEKYAHVAVGKTGLALLAFLGAGHTQSSDTEYSAHVARAIRFLISIQDEGSGHFGDSSAYCHGIATYALAECLALTSDASLREPITRAVAHILAAQSRRRDPRFFGGWGYYYNDDREFDPWPRTSITAWQVMALESARLSGLEVPDAAFDDARSFLRAAQDDEHGYVRYNHDPERLNSGYPTLPASTPAALFALALVGEDLASERYRPLLTYVLRRTPRDYRYTGDDDFVSRAQGNLYFWYYATLAMFRAGGSGWDAWNDAMKNTLLPAQQEDGSWKPIDIYARYARDRDGDRTYTTAMCVLSLEVYYRYYLPLLRVR